MDFKVGKKKSRIHISGERSLELHGENEPINQLTKVLIQSQAGKYVIGPLYYRVYLYYAKS